MAMKNLAFVFVAVMKAYLVKGTVAILMAMAAYAVSFHLIISFTGIGSSLNQALILNSKP